MEDTSFLFDAGQALIETLVEVGEQLVIEAHGVKDGGVEVSDVTWFFHRREAQFVGRPDRLAPADATAGQPHGESMPVVIAPRLVDSFTGGRASEFATPDQQRLLP